MELKHPAIAGTLESSDVQIAVEPLKEGLDLQIDSSVLSQFGNQIKSTVLDALEDMGVSNAKITVVDHGALDCTIRARVQCAVYRAIDQTENIPWGVTVV